MSGLSLMCCNRGSEESMSGESGHPCLMPLLLAKELEATPFTLIVAVGVE